MRRGARAKNSDPGRKDAGARAHTHAAGYRTESTVEQSEGHVNTSLVIHTEACVRAMARQEAYDGRWPRRCKQCFGADGDNYQKPSRKPPRSRARMN